MSNTYTREKQKRAFRNLQESSSGIMEYRSKLIFISMLEKHPGWNLNIIKAIADTRAMFVTIFQRPFELLGERRMKRRLNKFNRKD